MEGAKERNRTDYSDIVYGQNVNPSRWDVKGSWISPSAKHIE